MTMFRQIQRSMLVVLAMLTCVCSVNAAEVAFRKVTSVEDLVEGTRYIIVCEASNVAMGAFNSKSKRMSTVSITISDDIVRYYTSNTPVDIFTLGGNCDAYTLTGSKEGDYMGWDGSGTYFKIYSNKNDDKSQWTFKFTDVGNVKIRNLEDSTRIIRCSGTSYFGVYVGTSDGSPVQLYKEISLSKSTPTIPVADDEVTYGSNYEVNTASFASGDVSLSSGNEAVATVSGTTIIPQAVGSVVITVATAEAETYLAGEETFTLTVLAPEGLTDDDEAVYEEQVHINSNGFATYCSLYPLTFDAAAAYSAWEVTGIEGITVTFNRVLGAVRGGTGLFLRGTPNATITLTTTDSDATLSDNLLVGTTAPLYLPTEGSIYGFVGNQFLPNSASSTIRANRAYLPAEVVGEVESKSFTFVFNDSATGITTSLCVDAPTAQTVFNLSGQRVHGARKGISIVNGRLILNR